MIKEPIRCFEGNAKPHEAFWKFRNAVSAEEEPEMELYGYISEYSWFDDDVTPKMFKEELYKFGNNGPITIRMNSGGGDLIAASVMRTIITDYPGHVTVKIDGLAASAATIVALAGDQIKMQESAYFMIHDPAVSFLFATLNVEDVARLYFEMKSIKSGIVDAYETRTGLHPDKLARMMTNETWMSAREAQSYGFVDEVLTSGKNALAQNSFNDQAAFVNMITPELVKRYLNIPAALVQVEAPVLLDNHQVADEKFRAEVRLLI